MGESVGMGAFSGRFGGCRARRVSTSAVAHPWGGNRLSYDGTGMWPCGLGSCRDALELSRRSQERSWQGRAIDWTVGPLCGMSEMSGGRLRCRVDADGWKTLEV